MCQFARFGDSLQKAEIRGFYQKIDTTYLNTLWGLGLKSYLNIVVPPKIGDKYVDFKAFDLENKPHQLADFTGKYILLDFWSIGCEPCILSIPEMRLLAAKYSNILSLVSVNLDTNRSFWMESSKKENITWTNLSDGKGTFGGAGNAYGIKGIPLYALINQEGIIVEKWTGFKSGIFEEKLSKHLRNESIH